LSISPTISQPRSSKKLGFFRFLNESAKHLIAYKPCLAGYFQPGAIALKESPRFELTNHTVKGIVNALTKPVFKGLQV
jgi:hypothetical protein